LRQSGFRLIELVQEHEATTEVHQRRSDHRMPGGIGPLSHNERLTPACHRLVQATLVHPDSDLQPANSIVHLMLWAEGLGGSLQALPEQTVSLLELTDHFEATSQVRAVDRQLPFETRESLELDGSTQQSDGLLVLTSLPAEDGEVVHRARCIRVARSERAPA